MKEKTQTTVRLPNELKDKLQQEADRLGISFNELIIKLVREGLKSFCDIY